MKKLAASLLIPLLLIGCLSVATVASYLPIFEAALNGVLALVAPNASAQITADEAKVNAALAVLVSAVGQVQGAPSVAVALQDVAADATQLETDLGVSNNTDVKLATAILDLAIGTYEAIVQKANPPVATRLGARPRRYATSVGDFKRQYNTLCAQYGRPEMKMHLTLAQHLHLD